MVEIKNFHDSKRSLFQSVVRETLFKKNDGLRGLCAGHPMMQKVNDALGPDDVNKTLKDKKGCIGKIVGLFKKAEVCADLAFQLAMAKIEGNEKRATELENELKDSPCDPGWLEAVANYVEYYEIEGKKPKYIEWDGDPDFGVYPLPQGKTPDKLVVGLLGDWGTGEEEAELVLKELMKHKPDLIIHVGDIYYSGTSHEAHHNFLKIFNNARSNHPVPVYNLPGNHDYYSGGTAFYNILPELNKQPYAPAGTNVQEASFFCLRNDNWQLQGMDTGYCDHDLFKVGEDITQLHKSESKWHLDKIETAGNRKVILFSHHQLFSAFLNIGKLSHNKYLLADFKEQLDNGKITAWFWGHEHLLEVYEPYLGLQKGRCIGYSAFPMLIESNPYEVKYPEVPLLADPKNPDNFVKLGTSDKIYNHGYAVMELQNKDSNNESRVCYYQTEGDGSSCLSTLIFEESL